MNPYALHAPTDRTALRWIGSVVVIVAIYAGLIAAGLGWYRQQVPAGSEMPAIMVDMAPAAAAPEISQQDAAPGPEMLQAEAPSEPPPPPEPVIQQPIEEQVAPTPPVEQPVVEAPPEPKIEPTPPPPEPAKVEPEPPKPEPEKPAPTPKPERAEPKKKPSDTPPAPRTTAPPRVDRKATAASTASAGAAAAAALPSYRDRLAVHLQRYKQYPSEARSAGQQGVAMLSFTVSRSGQVLGSRLASSSGVAALDAETMAMIRRAQPLPAFPPEMTQASLSFTVPVRFSIR